VTSDACRPVTVTVDGQPETIRVHGGAAPSEQVAVALGQIIEAVRAEYAQTVRQAALGVLKAHWPEGGSCRCGHGAANATLWSVHVVAALAEAGVSRPLDETAADLWSVHETAAES
jgi:hypothetical protein